MHAIWARRQLEQGMCLSQRTFRRRQVTQLRGLSAGLPEAAALGWVAERGAPLVVNPPSIPAIGESLAGLVACEAVIGWSVKGSWWSISLRYRV
jgi:hypothetical protein